MGKSRRNARVHVRVDIAGDLPEQELEDWLTLARDRVIYAFKIASFFARGKWRRTSGWIGGLGDRQKHLVQHVLHLCKDQGKHFVTEAQVRRIFGRMTNKMAREFGDDIEEQLLTAVVEEMCSSRPPAREVYYMEDGTWNIIRTSIDSSDTSRRAAKKIRKRIKNDARPFHGRVRTQANRHGGCATSVGRHCYY